METCPRCQKEVASLSTLPKELEELAGFSEVCKPCFIAGGDLRSAAWGKAQKMLDKPFKPEPYYF